MSSDSVPHHRWDGSPAAPRHSRALRITPTHPCKLLRTAQAGRCTQCGHRVEWYARVDGEPVALHPAELDAAAVPAEDRWHVHAGIALPAGDGSAWCRITHRLVCPARDSACATTGQLVALRRRLAVRTRRLRDTGQFTPAAPSPAPGAVPCRPVRPVVELLYVRYLADRPLEELRCVAQTRTRRRCTQPVLHPTAPPGIWRLMPVAAPGQLPLPAPDMAVYTLAQLPYAEQLRWRAQRCPQHAVAGQAADTARRGWEVFDPLTHHAHIHPRLPTTARRPRHSRR